MNDKGGSGGSAPVPLVTTGRGTLSGKVATLSDVEGDLKDGVRLSVVLRFLRPLLEVSEALFTLFAGRMMFDDDARNGGGPRGFRGCLSSDPFGLPGRLWMTLKGGSGSVRAALYCLPPFG